MIDLYGAPGSQTRNAVTGQVGAVDFYQQSNYEKVYQFFTTITTEVHSSDDFATVLALEVIRFTRSTLLPRVPS